MNKLTYGATQNIIICDANSLVLHSPIVPTHSLPLHHRRHLPAECKHRTSAALSEYVIQPSGGATSRRHPTTVEVDIGVSRECTRRQLVRVQMCIVACKNKRSGTH